MEVNALLNEIIDEVVEETETEIVNELKSDFHYNNEWIFQYERNIKKLKKKNKLLEKQIYKACNHNWVRDYDDLYSRYKICTKCKLSNIPYK